MADSAEEGRAIFREAGLWLKIVDGKIVLIEAGKEDDD